MLIMTVLEEEHWGGLPGDGLVLGIATVIAACLAGFVGCLPLPEFSRLHFAEQREVSSEELANHPGVTRFRLRDGRVEAHTVHKKYHRHADKKPAVTYAHAVAPVRPPGWRPGDPVRVWAVCHDFSESDEQAACLDAWHEPPGGAVAVDPELEPCFQAAVPAETAPRDGRLVFVHWVKSPETYVEERWNEVIGFLRGTAIGWGAVAGLWFLGTSVVRLLFALRNLRATGDDAQ
ncbi:hypothetical protein [Hyalangium minutum]|nr:hypothetical protein [Hyalangium minutum]